MAQAHMCCRWRIAAVCNQFRAAWLIGAAIVALQMIDILSTEKILLAGGSETNAVVSALIGIFGTAWWVPKLILASFIAGYFGTRELSRVTIMAVALCGLVVAHNLLQPV